MVLNMWLDIDYLKYVWFVTWVDGSEFRAYLLDMRVTDIIWEI